MMKKSFVVTLACLMSLLIVGCGGGAKKTDTKAGDKDGKAVTIKVGHALSDSSAFQKALVKFKKDVESKTNGRIKIEVFANGALGSEGEMAEGLSMGTIDAALIGPSSVAKLYSNFEVFNLPYLFQSIEHADKVLLGDVGKKFASEIKNKSGVQVLSFWESGFRYYTNNKRQVVQPNDMQGLLIRIPNSKVQAATLKALGASATNLPIGEVYMACSNGTIDGEESPIDTIVTSNFNEVQKYMVMDGHVYAAMGFLMKGKLFDSLSKEDQKIIMECAHDAGIEERKIRRDLESTQVKNLKEKGMKISENVDKKEWRKAVQPVYDQFQKDFGKDLINSIEQAK